MDDSRNLSSPPSTPATGTAKSRRQRSTTKHIYESHSQSSTSASDHSAMPEFRGDEDRPRGVPRDLRRTLARSSRNFLSWLFSFMSLSKLMILGVQLLKLILIPIRFLSFRIFPTKEFDGVSNPAVADKAAQVFAEEMKKMIPLGLSEGSESLCPFVETGYMNTLSDIATTAQRFHSAQTSFHESLDQDELNLASSSSIPPLLLIYIHSPLHRQTTSFLKNQLLHPQTLELLHHHRSQGSLLCWGASIHSADGASVASSLGVSCFPFLAMVRSIPPSSSTVSTPSTRLELFFRIQGPALASLPLSLLHQYIATTLTRHEQKLSQIRLQAMTRMQERRLRQEQDYEYQRCLEEDRKKAKLKEMEEERLKLELEEARLEEERRQDLLQRLEAEKERKFHEAKVLVERSSSMEAKNTTRIRFVLPSGQRLEQKFNVEDTVGTLRAFMLLHLNEKFNDGTLSKPILNFDLCCNYPKKILREEESKLQDVDGLCPHAVIMVQDLDV